MNKWAVEAMELHNRRVESRKENIKISWRTKKRSENLLLPFNWFLLNSFPFNNACASQSSWARSVEIFSLTVDETRLLHYTVNIHNSLRGCEYSKGEKWGWIDSKYWSSLGELRGSEEWGWNWLRNQARITHFIICDGLSFSTARSSRELLKICPHPLAAFWQ